MRRSPARFIVSCTAFGASWDVRWSVAASTQVERKPLWVSRKAHGRRLKLSKASSRRTTQSEGSRRATEPGVSGLAYSALASSAAFMVAWVLFFPGSMWTGWATHDAFVDDVWTTFHLSTFSPSSLVLKYGDLGRSPALLHALPGAVWCALIPMQLRGFDGDAHRARGRVALAAAAVMMVGFALIDVSGLEADSYDFGGNGGGIASAADSLGVLPMPFNRGGTRTVAGWFVATGVLAWQTAAAKDAEAHRAWAIRHCGAGLWVALQRPSFAAWRMAQSVVLGGAAASTPAAQAEAFYYAAYIVTFVYFVGAEAVARGVVGRTDLRAKGEE